jgi:prevent-host-death family protein
MRGEKVTRKFSKPLPPPLDCDYNSASLESVLQGSGRVGDRRIDRAQKRQLVIDRRKGAQIMKIESLREVKAKLSKIVKDLPSDRSVIITKNGRPCAVLFPVTEETDLESMLLAQRKEFWQVLDRAHHEGEKKGFTRLKDLPD